MADNKSKIQELDFSLERLAKKQKTSFSKTLSQIDQLIAELNKCKSLISEDEMDVDSASNSNVNSTLDFSKKFKEMDFANKFNTESTELHAAISKYGKTIDKNFPTDLTKAFVEDIKFDHSLINQIIAQHLFRQGQFDCGQFFLKESKVQLSSSLEAPFSEMHKILHSIRSKNLQPALDWAYQHRKELLATDWLLEFKLHKLNYLHMLSLSKQDEALKYARKYFGEFSKIYMKEIQRLMGCFVYVGQLEKSPYSSYFHPNLWNDISHDFTSACCSLLGLSYESPLYTCVTAGGVSLPKYYKVTSMMLGKGMKVPPIEVELGTEFKFHPIFACPISREQTTTDNSPVMLSCGHVISKGSMIKLAKGNTRFKCPYCPAEVSTRALQITF